MVLEYFKKLWRYTFNSYVYPACRFQGVAYVWIEIVRMSRVDEFLTLCLERRICVCLIENNVYIAKDVKREYRSPPKQIQITPRAPELSIYHYATTPCALTTGSIFSTLFSISLALYNGCDSSNAPLPSARLSGKAALRPLHTSIATLSAFRSPKS